MLRLLSFVSVCQQYFSGFVKIAKIEWRITEFIGKHIGELRVIRVISDNYTKFRLISDIRRIIQIIKVIIIE